MSTIKRMTALAAVLLVTTFSSGAAQKSSVPAEPFQAGRPSLKVRPAGDKAIIFTVADAMGFVRGMGPQQTTATLNRLQWFGSGKLSEGGRDYTVSRYSYAMTLTLNGAREDIQRTGPDGKAERVVHAYLNTAAWDESAPGINPKSADSKAARERRLQYLRTPFGFTQGLLRADAASVKITDPGPGGTVTIVATLDGVPVTAKLDRYYRPASISMQVNDQLIEARYSGYKDIAEYGVMFPTRVTETLNGRPKLSLTIDDARVASYLILQPPADTAPGK